jgi:hypothetical protein
MVLSGYLEHTIVYISVDMHSRFSVFIYSMIYPGSSQMLHQTFPADSLQLLMRRLYGRERIKNENIILTIIP